MIASSLIIANGLFRIGYWRIWKGVPLRHIPLSGRPETKHINQSCFETRKSPNVPVMEVEATYNKAKVEVQKKAVTSYQEISLEPKLDLTLQQCRDLIRLQIGIEETGINVVLNRALLEINSSELTNQCESAPNMLCKAQLIAAACGAVV